MVCSVTNTTSKERAIAAEVNDSGRGLRYCDEAARDLDAGS